MVIFLAELEVLSVYVSKLKEMVGVPCTVAIRVARDARGIKKS